MWWPDAAIGWPVRSGLPAGQEHGATAIPAFLRYVIESEHQGGIRDRLTTAFLRAMPGRDQARFAALLVDDAGHSYTFASSGARVDPVGSAATMVSNSSPAPGEPVVLSLNPDAGEGVRVRIVFKTVTAARESWFQKFIYTPGIWASTFALRPSPVRHGFRDGHDQAGAARRADTRPR